MTSAIYAIVNNITNDMYVGSAVAVNRRWSAHRNLLTKQCHYNLQLQRAYNKYGNKAFDWEIVQFVDSFLCCMLFCLHRVYLRITTICI